MKVFLAQYAGMDAIAGLPLAAGLLASTARLDPVIAATVNWHIEVEREALDRAVDRLCGVNLLGLSLYPWNSAYSLAVAAAARRALPGLFQVAGGPSVPRRVDSAHAFMQANPHLDAMVLGEGEFAFTALLRALLHGHDLADVPSLVYREAGDGIRFTTPARRIHDLALTASPYLDGSFDELIARHPGRFAMAVCETNRGCPFACTFCDWSTTPRVVEYPIERVRAEIEWVAASGLSQLCFTDANFGMRPRDSDIAAFLAEQKQRTGGPRGCYFYLTKNNHRRNLQTIEIFTAAGIDHCVGLAVQDFDDDVLAAVKRDNIQSEESIRLGDICAERGIRTHNELILGLPRQTYESFAATLLKAMSGHPRHDFRIFLCRLIDNTELADASTRERYAIDSRRCLWRPADLAFDPVVDEYQELVVATLHMPLHEWRRTCRFAYLAAAGYNQRLLRHVLRFLGDAGLDRKSWLEALCRLMEPTSGSRCFAAIGSAVDKLLDSMLGNGPLALPVPGHGPQLHELAETITVVALADLGAFHEETRRVTLAHFADRVEPPVLDELLRFQAMCTPRRGRVEPEEQDFEHDWLAYVEGPAGSPLLSVPTRLRFEPPGFARLEDRAGFDALYLACSLSGTGLGELTRISEHTACRPARAGAAALRAWLQKASS